MSARRHLIAALSEDSLGGIATLNDVTHAEHLVDAYQAEVLRGEATNLRRIEREEVPAGAFGTKTGLLKAALILDERVDNLREKTTPTTAGTAVTPEFFRAGRTYRSRRCADLRFECLALSADPDNGDRQAIGWRFGPPHGGVRQHRLAALGAEDWTCCDWTETTEGGDSDA